METAGVGLGATVGHTLLEEKDNEDPMVDVHEISKPDTLPSSDPEEVEHEADPVTEPEELPENDDSWHLPTTDETLNEPESLESKDEVHGVTHSEPLTDPPTEPISEEEEVTRDPPAEEVGNDAAAVEPDIEVNKEMTLPEETGNSYYLFEANSLVEAEDIKDEVPAFADDTESPIHEAHTDEIPPAVGDAMETHEPVEHAETPEHTERDVVDETQDEPTTEVPAIATHEETEEDRTTLHASDASTQPTEETNLLEETPIEPVSEVPAIETQQETKEELQGSVDERADEPMAEETDDKPLEGSSVDEQQTEEPREPDLVEETPEPPATVEHENVEESHTEETTHPEDPPTEEGHEPDVIHEPPNESTSEVPAIPEQENPEDGVNHIVLDPAPHQTEHSKESEELAALSAVPAIESIADDHSAPPSEETTPGEIEEIDHSGPTVDPVSEQPAETNTEPVPESAETVEKRSMEDSPATEGVDEPEKSTAVEESVVPTEVGLPPSELQVETPVDDANEQPVATTEEISKDHIEEHEQVDPASEAPVEETPIEEPDENLAVEIPEPVTIADEEVQMDEEPAEEDSEHPDEEDVEESPHDSIPTAAEVFGVTAIAVGGVAVAEHEHVHVPVGESLHPEPSEPVVEDTTAEHVDAPVDGPIDAPLPEPAETGENVDEVVVAAEDLDSGIDEPVELPHTDSTESKEIVEDAVADDVDAPTEEPLEAVEPTKSKEAVGDTVDDHLLVPVDESLETSDVEPAETDEIAEHAVAETEHVDAPTDETVEAPEPAESTEIVADATEEPHVVTVDEPLEISQPDPVETKDTAADAISEHPDAPSEEHLQAFEQGEELDSKLSDHGFEQPVEESKEEPVEDFTEVFHNTHEQAKKKKQEEVDSLREPDIDEVGSHIHEPVETAIEAPLGVVDEEHIDEPNSTSVMEHVDEPIEEPVHDHDTEIALAGAALAGTSAIGGLVLAHHHLDQQDHPPPYELRPPKEAQISERNENPADEKVIEPDIHVTEWVESPADNEEGLGTASEPAIHDPTDAHEDQQVEESIVEDVPSVPEDEIVDALDEHENIPVQDQSSPVQHSEIAAESAVNVPPIEESEEFMHDIADEHNVDEQHEPLEDLEQIPLAPVASKIEHPSVPLEESVPPPDEMQEESAKEPQEGPLEHSLEQQEEDREIPEEHHSMEETAVTIDNVDSPQINLDEVPLDSEETQAVDDEPHQQLTEETPVVEGAATPLVEDVEPQITEPTYEAQEPTVEVQPTIVEDEAKENASVEQAESAQVLVVY